MIKKTSAKFVKRETAVVRELIAHLDNVEECNCYHCETRVMKRALDAYVLHLAAAPSHAPDSSARI